MRRYALVLAVLALSLAACKPGDDPVPDPKAAAAKKPEPTVLDEVTKVPMDKARGVEQQVLDQAEEQRKQIEKAEGG